jgi:hypothetical protein
MTELYFGCSNALQVHARLGEVLFVFANSTNAGSDDNVEKNLTEATRRFCRSIELCDDYLRGYYGLKLVRAFTT